MFSFTAKLSNTSNISCQPRHSHIGCDQARERSGSNRFVSCVSANEWWIRQNLYIFFIKMFVFQHVFSDSLIVVGDRTFGVLTKLDLMDKGTNALDVSVLPSLSFSSLLVFLSNFLLLEVVLQESTCLVYIVFTMLAILKCLP